MPQDSTWLDDPEPGSLVQIGDEDRFYEGEMPGVKLEILPHRDELWFAWPGFFGDAPVWEG